MAQYVKDGFYELDEDHVEYVSNRPEQYPGGLSPTSPKKTETRISCSTIGQQT